MTDLPSILIVDDEIRSLEALERILDTQFDVKTARDIDEANEILENEWIQVILCDQRMPNKTGVEFLTEVRSRWPDIIRMIISGYSDPHDIIEGLNEAGIYQYITKPWHPENLILTLENAVRLYKLQRDNELLAIELKMSVSDAENRISSRKQRLRKEYDFNDGIVRSKNSPMNAVCETLRQVAPYDVPVVITGASGTGKELAARALHYGSLRWNKPFVVENCGALPDQLLESELFGHKRGAFTGAVSDHIGLFERADGGTVFLDEIGEISKTFQVKLLRVLQEGEIRPVGSGKSKKVDVRVIAATNKNLDDEVKAGNFRADLYYRLTGMTIQLPPLKERAGDIPVLAHALLGNTMKKLDKQVQGLDEEAIECLCAYDWPGNVRELQNEIQHMLVIGEEGKLLGADLISKHILLASPEEEEGYLDSFANLEGTLRERVDALEARIIKETLIRHRWNKSQAAKELGLSRVGLRSKLDRFGLENVKPIRTKRAASSGS